MSWRTSKTVVMARNLGRSLGLNKIVASLVAGKHYEDRFQSAMLAALKPGQVVWDVGANLGLYSKQFADRVGPEGRVIAFEPSPSNLEKLNAAVAGIGNITVVPFGLGAQDEKLAFEQGADDLGATSRFVADAGVGPTALWQSIDVRRGDGLVETGLVPGPEVIKIDTEGFELDVLTGLEGVLANPRLRTLCIEVHFRLLEARGLPDAAARLEKLLVRAGFSLAWPDASHIVAERRT